MVPNGSAILRLILFHHHHHPRLLLLKHQNIRLPSPPNRLKLLHPTRLHELRLGTSQRGGLDRRVFANVGAWFHYTLLDAVPDVFLDAATAKLLKAGEANGEWVARRALFVVFDAPGGGIAGMDRGREFRRVGGRTGGRAGGAGESARDGRHGGGGL